MENQNLEINLPRALRNHSLVASLVGLGVFGLLAYRTIREPLKYQSDSLILIANQNTVPLVPPLREDNPDQKKDAQANDIEILKSRALLTRAINRLGAQNELTPGKLEDNLTLRQSKGTDILLVSYIDNDPLKAKEILEALVSTYLDYSHESKLSPVRNAIGFIERILPKIQINLKRSSEKITAFRKDNGLDNPDANAALAFQRKQEINQRLTEAKANLNQGQKLYQSLQSQANQVGQNSSKIIPSAIVSQDSTYQALVNQLNTIQIQYSLEGTRYLPNHPIMRELQERSERINQLIKERISQVMGLPKQVTSSGPIQQDLAVQLLKAQINLVDLSQRLRDIQWLKSQADLDFERIIQLQQQYRELERQYRLNSQDVDSFLTKLRELKIREVQEISSWKIVQPPSLPNVPINSNYWRSLLIALVLGILSAAAVAYLLEKFGQSIKEPEKIKELTSLPLLGQIPLAKRVNPFLLNELPLVDPFSEAIRSLALVILGQKTSNKTIALVSAIEQEGKSTITHNLGYALAELGQKVLIVDADLLEPNIDEICNLSNVVGLTTALSSDTSWREFIQQSQPKEQSNNSKASSQSSWSGSLSLQTLISTKKPGYLSPDILTAGPSLLSPGAWLASEKMGTFIKQWQESYDLVLLDTHSLTGLIGTQSLLSKVDEVILIVRMKHLNRSQLNNAMEVLNRSQCQISGMVLNN
ncbi:MAG: polysaccharide biosynthesis tyrosine autokinase [Cyanobacteriota bacterium ELA615]